MFFETARAFDARAVSTIRQDPAVPVEFIGQRRFVPLKRAYSNAAATRAPPRPAPTAIDTRRASESI
jgi:hypothetical protein